MEHKESIYPKEKKELYRLLHAQLAELITGIPHETANLANASALLYHALECVNWAGFYVMEEDRLVLGPFQGKPACIEIPVGRGVCGTAALRDAPVVVEDVHLFPGHIACDEASRSEIVIPVHVRGKLYGVLDIDSPQPGRFEEADLEGLTEFVHILERDGNLG